MLINRTVLRSLQKNLETIGSYPPYTPRGTSFRKEDQESVKQASIGWSQEIKPLEETLEHSMGGSTDWVIELNVAQ